MKKIVIGLTVIIAIAVSSCSSSETPSAEGSNSETTEGNSTESSNDVATIEINSMLDNFEAGLVPFVTLKDIEKYNIVPTQKGTWEYESVEENDGIEIVKVYKKYAEDKDIIQGYYIDIYMSEKLEFDSDDYETDEELEKAEAEEEIKEKEFEDKCYNLINDRLSDATYELFNGDHSWIITKGDSEFHISIAFNYYDLTLHVW